MKKKDDNKEDIKKKVKISSYFDKLIKTPSGYKCLCPFHKEDTPSFYITVKDDIELFKCFGCDKGGDIFTFISLYEQKDFIEVYNDLAVQLGYKASYKASLKPYIDVINKANNHYKKEIWKHQDVLDFLSKRNITKDDINFFGLGFAQTSIIPSLDQKANELEIAKEIGIINKSDDIGATYFDMIRNRITIPLFSKQNLTVGISSRKFYDTDTYGKYINPSNSKIYKKNSFIYGLNFSLEEIKNKNSVIIVEGYFDFIKLYKSGVKNVVCILGTKLFSDQVKTLASLTDNFYFCLDGDLAGQNALVNNIKEAIKYGVNIYITELPTDHDPDSFIDEFGISEFNKKITNSVNFIEYISNKKDLMIPMLEDIQLLIPKITSTVKQQFFYNNIKHFTGIDLSKSADVKKAYFNRFQSETMTQNDISILKVFYNAEEENKSLISGIFDTDKAKLLYLKLKNKDYKIELTEEENNFLKTIDIGKKYTKEEIQTIITNIGERKRLLKMQE